MLQYFSFHMQQFHETNDFNQASWIHIQNPSPEEITQLTKTYHIPQDYLTCVQDEQENARHEGLHQSELDQPVLLLLQYPEAKISPTGYSQVLVEPIAIIVTKNQLLTVTNKPASIVQKLIQTSLDTSMLSLPEAAALTLGIFIGRMFNEFLTKLRHQTETMESQVKVATENNQLYQLMDIQKSLIYFQAALENVLPVATSLYKTKILMTSSEATNQLHDIVVEFKQALSTTKIQLQLVGQISNIFSSIVSNNLNIIMKILTSLTIVLTIPSVIGALYGMNVKLPFADNENAFWFISLLTCGICWLCIRLLKRNKFF